MNKSLRPRRSLLALLLAISILSARSFVTAAQEEFVPEFEPGACAFEGIDLGMASLTGEQLGFECGTITVPLHHENPEGATIRLPVAVLRANGPDAQPDALFAAQGGPGGDAFGVYSILAPSSPMAADRDIVVFNQRGTKYSEPDLTCTEVFDASGPSLSVDPDEAEQLYQQALTDCHQRLVNQGIDLSAFNSLQNAADVPLIARALGYDDFNFYGVSYGTLLGLHLMNLQPEGLRSVILDSVVPTNVNFIVEAAASENRAYDELFAACAANEVCAADYPDLESRYFQLVEKLDDEPVMLTIENTESGESYDATLNGSVLRSFMFQLFYLPDMPAVFPRIVTGLENGDYRYIEQMWPLFVFDESISEGMYYSTICAEDSDFDPAAVDISMLRPQIGESVSDDLATFRESCDIFQVEQLPASIDDPVNSEIPTLLLSGNFDPITPPQMAATAAVTLPNSYNLVDPQSSHGVAFLDACANEVVAAFLNNPQEVPDSSCLDAKQMPDVVPPGAVTLPLVGSVNSLEPGLLGQAGAGALLLMIVLSGFAVWPGIFLVRAVLDKQPELTDEGKRIRLIGRILMLLFGGLTFIFATGLSAYVGAALANQTYALALTISESAVWLLWLPIILAILAIACAVMVVLLWRQSGSGSIWGKIYYTVLVLCALGILVLLAGQNLLLPPL